VLLENKRRGKDKKKKRENPFFSFLPPTSFASFTPPAPLFYFLFYFILFSFFFLFSFFYSFLFFFKKKKKREKKEEKKKRKEKIKIKSNSRWGFTRGRVVYPWSSYQKIGFVRNTFVPLLDAAEQVFIVFFLFSFFFFLATKCFYSVFPSSTKEERENERKKEKKSPKNNTRAWTSSIFGNVRIKSPFTTTKKGRGEWKKKKELPFDISLWWKYSVKQNTGVLLHLFFFFHVLLPPPSVIFSTVSNLRGVQLLTGSR